MGLLYKVTIHNTNKSKIFFLRKSAINFVEKHFFPNGGNKDDYLILKNGEVVDSEGYLLGVIDPPPTGIHRNLFFIYTGFYLISFGIIAYSVIKNIWSK